MTKDISGVNSFKVGDRARYVNGDPMWNGIIGTIKREFWDGAVEWEPDNFPEGCEYKEYAVRSSLDLYTWILEPVPLPADSNYTID